MSNLLISFSSDVEAGCLLLLLPEMSLESRRSPSLNSIGLDAKQRSVASEATQRSSDRSGLDQFRGGQCVASGRSRAPSKCPEA